MSAVAQQVYGDCPAFLASVAEARERLLFMDYDGTIAPFTVNRSKAFPYDDLPCLIEAVTRCKTRVVLITGRPAREVPHLLGVQPQPEVWGTHGLERLAPDGHYSVGDVDQKAGEALGVAAGWAYESGLGALVEQKTGAVALHWRGYAPAYIEQVRERAYPAFARLACQANLRLCEFDGGLELRARSCDKGHAVRAVLAEVDEEAAVAYLGDDLTDEDAFRALSGRGFTALVRPRYRPTTADVWLRPPDELISFLSEWIRVCGGTS